MGVPTDPYPDFRNNIDVADGDQVDARFKALYDALNPAIIGIDGSNVVDGSLGLGELATAVLNNFVKLLVAGDHKLAFGKVNTPPSFGGGREVALNIAHGLGGTPAWMHVTDSYVDAGNNSSAVNQPVVSAISGADATNIGVKFFLPIGVTSGVGAASVWWAALT